MPELPEVETVRRGLNRVTLAQPIQGGIVLLERTIAYPVSVDGFLAGLENCAIAHWHRRGKYLLGQLVRLEPNETLLPAEALETLTDGDDIAEAAARPGHAGWLGVHLRMTGQLLWLHQSDPVQKHCRVRLLFQNQRELRFVDQRTFGQMWWVPPDRSPDEVMGAGYAALGPEPLSSAFTVDCLRTALKRRHRPIKNALLDQSIVAGIGNIYADESLFLGGIRPTTLCDRLTRKQFEALHSNIIAVLESSIGEGGTTFSDFRDIEGINGNYGSMAWVYGRDGTPCRVCGETIQRIKMAGRSTHFCKSCQK
ncbi:MAG: DNA-formamidopyrimidine glycosylase [Elainellaceae cyanobacterium]